MELLVIDAQGGGLGKMLIAEIKKEMPELEVAAIEPIVQPQLL